MFRLFAEGIAALSLSLTRTRVDHAAKKRKTLPFFCRIAAHRVPGMLWIPDFLTDCLSPKILTAVAAGSDGSFAAAFLASSGNFTLQLQEPG